MVKPKSTAEFAPRTCLRQKKPLEKGDYLQGSNAVSLMPRYGPAQGGEAGGDSSPIIKIEHPNESFIYLLDSY
jgi:hypothetical protein